MQRYFMVSMMLDPISLLCVLVVRAVAPLHRQK